MGYFLVFVFVLGLVYFFVFRSTDEYNNGRTQFIEDFILSKGGEVISITKVKKSAFPHKEEFGLDQDIVYIPYQVSYTISDQDVNGWAILIIEGTYLGSMVMTKNKWIFKL